MFKNWKIKQLNKRASAEKFKPQEVINSLGIKEGDAIADIGRAVVITLLNLPNWSVKAVKSLQSIQSKNS